MLKYFLQGLAIDLGPTFNYRVNNNLKDFGPDVANDFELSGLLGLSYTMNNGLFAKIRYKKALSKVFDKEEYGD